MNTIISFLIAVAIMLGVNVGMNHPSIGGTIIPSNLHCQEDEVIEFIGMDTLACVHAEQLCEDQTDAHCWLETDR